jgi:Bacterial Ig-like domain
MSMHHDPDLDDILQDDELVRLAGLLQSTRRTEPPLDDAFRSALRRQLMQKAWEMGEGRSPWWRRSATPAPRRPAMAWAVAAVGVLLIGSVVVLIANQQPGELTITSPMADTRAVQLQSPILVSFSQPMDHQSTEAAVQIAPATTVTFSWQGNTLAVQPAAGNLAPSTQYRVTIGPGARTQAGQQVPSATTITFVTQPSSTPPPLARPTPTATPASSLTAEQRLATLPSGRLDPPQWSADSTTLYVVGDNGALESIAVSGGSLNVIVPDGVTYPAIAPAGDRLAYYRGGKIEVLRLAIGVTSDRAVVTNLTALSWAKDQLMWGNSDGVFKMGPGGNPVQLAAIPNDAAVLSIAPDGTHAVYKQGHLLFVLDLTTSQPSRFGQIGGQFLGWSPDGPRMLYSGQGRTVVADDNGQGLAMLPPGDPSWSSQDEILIGSDVSLSEVRADGSGQTKLIDGTYRLPAWAPNGTAFAFVRGGAIWSATIAPAVSEPPALDQAFAVVSSFMNARLQRQADQAASFLDGNAKQAYGNGGIPLLITGDAGFSRFYVLTQEITGSRPDIARFVVRLVLSKSGLDVSAYEETLILQRSQAGQPFLIDQATAGPSRDLGRGAGVVGVQVSGGIIRVVFDSDLISGTVGDGVFVLDASGQRVGHAATYANRIVVITGLQLVPGATYRLVVQTTVLDVSGRNVPSEYDLNIIGPAAGGTGSQGDVVILPAEDPTQALPTASPVGSPTT